jgi:hypothetical protein
MRLVFGDECVEKVAESAHDRARLQVEAATLRAVAHPGVVRLVSAADGRIRTRRVTGRNLSEVPLQAPQVTAAWGAALCTTVGDLHEIGCVHTAIAADHVIMDGDGHPVLCGLGNATWPSEPAERDQLAQRDRRDVAALIGDRLTGDLARRTRPARHPRSRLNPMQRAGGLRVERRLRRMLVDESGGRDESWLRDLARRLSEYSRLPQAESADPARPARQLPPKAGGETTAGRVAATGGQAQGASSGACRALQALRAAVCRRRLAATALTAAAVIALVLAVTLRSGASPQVPTAPGERTVTVVGPSGSLDLSTWSAGQVSLTAGRWTCSKVMPALLDVSSGNIWTFPGWPGPGGHDRGTLVARVVGAVALRSLPSGHGCDTLAAITAAGASAVVKLSGSR